MRSDDVFLLGIDLRIFGVLGYFEGKSVMAEIDPLWSDGIEDDVFVNENPVRHDVVLLQIEKVISAERSWDLALLCICIIIRGPRVGGIFRPASKLAQVHDWVRFAVSPHVS